MENNNFDTLETAQAEIIRLNEELTALRTERDSLSENNNQLSTDNENLRKLNQTYFNKLSMQFIPDDGENKHEKTNEPASLEEIALQLLSNI